jgi:ketosteroid isomerase-like protein
MKKIRVVLGTLAAIAMLTLGFGAFAHAAGNAKDKQQIEDIEHNIIDATSADQVMKYYDKNNIDLYDFHPPLQYQGETAVKEDLADFFNNAKDVKGKFVELVVVTDGKMGMARSIQHFTWTGKDGKPAEGTFRVTDVFQKENGQWKVIHSHVSVPVDPATGKAEMNLQS